jgi:hypothetical protein
MFLCIINHQNTLYAERFSENARSFLQDAWIWENNQLQKEKQFSLKSKTDVVKLTKKMQLASYIQDYKHKMNIMHDNEIIPLKEYGTNILFIMPKKVLDSLIAKNIIKQYSLIDNQNNRPPPLPPRNNPVIPPVKPPRRRKTIDSQSNDTALQVTEDTNNKKQEPPQDDFAKELQKGRTSLRPRPIKEKEAPDDQTLAQQLQDQQAKLKKTEPAPKKPSSTQSPLTTNLKEKTNDFIQVLQRRRGAIADDNDNTTQNNETDETWDTD